MYKGIDVSSNNGALDWDRILLDGIQFAIIRIGYGSDEESQDDSEAIANMKACEAIGLPYGVYIYSYALTEDNVKSEVQHTLRMIEGFNPQLGTFFDMEDADGYKARNGLIPEDNGTILTDFCCLFCDEMESNGYKVGIYANKNYFDNILDKSRFDNYMKWLAIWGPDEVPEGDWILWQYTSDGVVDGSNARTDMNYFYGEFETVEPITEQVEESAPQEESESTIEPQEVIDTYTVQPNDCLSVIGENLGINWKAIADINGISEPYEVYPGQVLKLVADATQEAPVEESQTEEVAEVGLIEQVQKYINSYGFGIDEDNIYGPQTKDGLVKAYQQAMNDTYDTCLEVDGIFGQQSRKSANNLLTIGMSNEIVKALQASLQAIYSYDMKGIDGIFGYLTNSSVLDFQSNSGLATDGIVGPDTWSAIFA